MAAIAFVALLLRGARLGRGQVTVGRRLWITALLAIGTSMPWVPCWIVPPTFGRGIAKVTGAWLEDEQHPEGRFVPIEELPSEIVAGMVETDEARGGPELFVVLCAWLSLIGIAGQMLRLPRKLAVIGELPPVADPALGARIAELARSLGLPPPLVVQPRTAHGHANAFAAGVLAPIVAVYDGIALRLSPTERDAVIAHELGHLAGRHLLWGFARTVLVAVAAVVVSMFVPLLVALAWLLAAAIALPVVTGWRRERDADRRAAAVVGSAAMTAALDKIHAVNGLPPAAAWRFALVTHPPLAVRAFWLAADAAPSPLVARCLRARRIVLLLIGVALAAAVLLGRWPATAPLGIGLAVLLALV
jgi:hypothetical protein